MVDIDHDCAMVEIVGSRINLGGTLAYFDIDGRFRILSTLALHSPGDAGRYGKIAGFSAPGKTLGRQSL